MCECFPIIGWGIAAIVVAYVVYEGLNELSDHINKNDNEAFEEENRAENPVIENIKPQNKPKGNNKRHTSSQEALNEIAKEGERKGVTNSDADTLLNWADEYDLQGRDDRGKDHWIGGEHIHVGGKHIPITP